MRVRARTRAHRLTGAVMFALATTVPATAEATVTIGSDLARTPDFGQGCAPQCTVVPTAISVGAEPAGIVSPVNGTVVTWRVRTGASTRASAFRIVRLLADGSATASATSPTVVPPVDGVGAFPVQLPIKIGDTIGLDCCNPGSADIGVAGNGKRNVYLPRLTDGALAQMLTSSATFELAINADIEPTSVFTISAVKAGKGGKETVTATLPNPGTLKAGDIRDASLASASAAAAKKQKYLAHASAPVSVAGQTIRLLVKPTKLARTRLAEKGRLKASLKVVFTPTGGSPSAQVIKVKLKR